MPYLLAIPQYWGDLYNPCGAPTALALYQCSVYGTVVPKMGLEPIRCCHRQILSLVRLPIPPLWHMAESQGLEP